MRKYFIHISLSCIACLLFFSCANDQNQSNLDQENMQSPVQDQTKETSQIQPVSLTKTEAEKLMRNFLKENSKTYKDYGEIQDLFLVSGNYNNDDKLDFFYTINFYPGGDFIYPTHFFYNSMLDNIQELKMNKTIEFIQSIDVTDINLGKLLGSASIWNAISGEHIASRSVKAEFTIEGNKISCDNKYMPAFKKAQKEIDKELERMEKEMMEEADAFNSDGILFAYSLIKSLQLNHSKS